MNVDIDQSPLCGFKIVFASVDCGLWIQLTVTDPLLTSPFSILLLHNGDGDPRSFRVLGVLVTFELSIFRSASFLRSLCMARTGNVGETKIGRFPFSDGRQTKRGSVHGISFDLEARDDTV